MEFLRLRLPESDSQHSPCWCPEPKLNRLDRLNSYRAWRVEEGFCDASKKSKTTLLNRSGSSIWGTWPVFSTISNVTFSPKHLRHVPCKKKVLIRQSEITIYCRNLTASIFTVCSCELWLVTAIGSIVPYGTGYSGPSLQLHHSDYYEVTSWRQMPFPREISDRGLPRWAKRPAIDDISSVTE